jgi:hypothetical protein
LIVGEYPPLFEKFRAKLFKVLWRGSRDGFTAQEFHRRCDGRAKTLTLIADTNGNLFGGFRAVEWDSDASGKYKGDDSLRMRLFTFVGIDLGKSGPNPTSFRMRHRRAIRYSQQ